MGSTGAQGQQQSVAMLAMQGTPMNTAAHPNEGGSKVGRWGCVS
jgi:hypothetical protein